MEGIRELTCAMMNIEPLRMSAVGFSVMKEERRLLTEAINALDKDLLVADAADRYPQTAGVPWREFAWKHGMHYGAPARRWPPAGSWPTS